MNVRFREPLSRKSFSVLDLGLVYVAECGVGGLVSKRSNYYNNEQASCVEVNKHTPSLGPNLDQIPDMLAT